MIKTFTRNQFAGILSILLVLTACSGQWEESKKETNALRLKVTVASHWGIGYGMIYDCEVKSVEEGMLADKKISLLLMDPKYYEFLDKKEISSEILMISFRRKGKNKEDNFPYYDGFIGKNRTEWEVVSLK